MAHTSTQHPPRAIHMVNTLLVAAGGGIGALARYGIVCSTALLLIDARWAEFIANISGSFLMGIVVGWFAFYGKGSGRLQLFLTTGILGGYTTFSGFSLDAVTLMEQENYALAAAYITGSAALSIFGLFAGLRLIRHFTNGKTR